MYTKEEAQEIRHAFWHKLESKSRRLPGQNGKPVVWIGSKTGVKGLDLRFDVSGGKVIVGIEINTHSEEKDEELWAKMENCRKLIERHFEAEVKWEREYVREAGNKVARIYVETTGDIYQKEQWPDMIYFMLDNMLRLEAAYREIRDYVVHF
ncbi:MAG: DUF4268 domain-containing protein [Bacteroidales bacterium]|nr:DUF4268 domain-containing protein [Bacteroidales bacterium]